MLARFQIAAVLCLSTILVPAAEDEITTNEVSRLSVTSIFAEETFDVESYSARWADHGAGYHRTVDSVATKNGEDIVSIEPSTGATNILVLAEDLIPAGQDSPLSIAGYEFSRDLSKVLIFSNTRRVWRHHDRGDYWVLDRSSLELRKLGGNAPPSSLMHAKLSPDGRHVGYVLDRNIYAEELQGGRIQQLTTTPGGDLINGAFDWVYEEEFEMRDGWRWNPDGTAIAFWQIDSSEVRKFPLIDNVSGLYPEIQWIAYPKAGERNPAARAGVADLADGGINWLQIPGDPRNHYLHSLEWPEHAGGVVVQQLNRLQNTNHVFIADPATGTVRELFTETDPAWVDVRVPNRWAEESGLFPWLSERDGWRRLYAVNAENGHAERLFDEDLDVISIVRFVAESGDVYFLASPGNATQSYLYRASIRTGTPQRLTPADQPGTHNYSISRDGKWALDTWSSINVPPVVQLISLPDHCLVRVLEDNQKLRDRLAKLELPPFEFFQAQATPELAVDAYCLKPPGFDPDGKYPVVVYVYGEPAGQTVRDLWQGKNGLWHRLLAQEGFVILSFDNRGTPAPRGSEWRKSIYRQVGTLAVADQANALQHTLAARPYLDVERVGIWGWSGGGSMTLNALLKHPELYQAGIAVAAVPNLRLYDTIYQERYMGLPDDNVEGYRAGSPLHFAHQLEGRLLLVHGTGDDNVHYQGAEALIDRLVHHQKQFELLIYPNRSHGISEGQNTTVHLREAMLNFWRNSLRPESRP